MTVTPTPRRFHHHTLLPDAPCPSNIRRIDLGALPQFVEMSRRGIRVDLPALASISTQLQERMTSLESEISGLLGRRLSYNADGRPEIASPPKVADLLFHQLRVQGDGPPPRLTDTGAWEATGEPVLQLYRDNHPVIDLILSWRECDKLDGTYCRPIPKMVDPETHRLHTTWKLTTAATGRVASEDPNLMNIPSRGEWGPLIRNCFIASPGRVFVHCDLSQIEMVWVAHLAQEEAMLSVIRSGGDIHRTNAADMYTLPLDSITKDQRAAAKTTGFGVVYLIGPTGLQAQIRNHTGELWPETQCDQFLSRFYTVRPAISQWHGLQFQRARRYGMVWCPFGRVRRIPEVRSSLRWVENSGLRQAANQPVQAAAQSTMKLAQAEIHPHQQLANRGAVCWPLIQEHDALLFECDRSIAHDFGELCRYIMEQAVEISVPIRASMDIGERWGEVK